MTASEVRGIDLFKIAGRSISGWIPGLKTGNSHHVRQPFCSQLEERFLMYQEYHLQVTWYARGDIDAHFAATYRLPTPKDAPFAIGYVFEGQPNHYLPDVVGTLANGKLFILDKLQPFCRIAGHTSAKMLEILATLETVCCETFPQLNLRRWGYSIYGWLTHPLLDPTGSGRVVMDHLMKLVSTALEWSYEAGEQDVLAETLEKAAELLTLGRNAILLIDGAGSTVEMPQSDTTEQKGMQEAEAGEAKASDAPTQRDFHRDEVGET